MSKVKNEVQKHVQEFLTTKPMGEYHELFDSKEDWLVEKEKLVKKIDLMLEQVEKDDYKNAVVSINQMIIRLGNWKSKLNNTL